ncbi:MAG: recombinase RecD [Candidatus Latescibacteria bacterium 4484_107]|nr:MAG: recombinase RecD [Candidatus Latescibacteria bacterium 4484_107]
MNASPDLDTLEGVIERITFHADDTGYTVAKLRAKGAGPEPVTLVGSVAEIHPGESVRLKGHWTTHPQYGRQFRIVEYQTVYPSTVEGIRKYLGSGLIKGIGPVTAKRIVAQFGLKTLDIIERAPDRLTEVEGLGPKRAEMIKHAWIEQQEIKEVMLFLQSHDVSTAYAVKIWKQYGDDAIRIVRENPYRLAKDIWGIGFLIADRIAQNLGVDPESAMRLKAGLRYVLGQASEKEGHVFLPADLLISRAAEILKAPEKKLRPCLNDLSREQEVILEDEHVYLPPLHYAEQAVSKKLHQLAQVSKVELRDLGEEVRAVEKRTGFTFAERQKEAIAKALSENVLILTGGPGTGKTTTVLGMIALFARRSRSIALCAPTGRAAKRMSEATGREAKTIHRLLKFQPRGGFEYDGNPPLPADVVIVDEVSMIDILLMHHLLKAVRPSATIVFVGDVDQLPSVGPGNVLRDMIASGTVSTVRLDQIFRQARRSRIVVNAHRINEGFFPYIKNERAGDFFFIEKAEPAEIVETILSLCTERLPLHYEYDPIDDIQVLAPMYRGETGTINLNHALQQRLNPQGAEIRRGDTLFRVGDKVMQIRNNYQKEVFNGDIGRIVSIDLEEQEMRVRFDTLASYTFSELDELVLAYAISIHKSQGCEFKAVVFPLTTQHYMMLQRNLLYTAITRARELVVLVGTKKALGIAVKNDKVSERYTGLAARLGE